MHNVHKVVAVDHPVDRLKVPNSRLGSVDRHGRPVPMVGRPTGRPTVGSGCFGKDAELEICSSCERIPRVFSEVYERGRALFIVYAENIVLIHKNQ